MSPSKNNDRDARETRDRLRRYTARQSVHSHQIARRRRDNIVAVASVVVVATLATLTQVFYFSSGPGMPAPSASPASSSPPAANTNVGNVPAQSIAEARPWTGTLSLNDVKLGITLDGARAPQAASVFISLAKSNFYTGAGADCFRLSNAVSLNILQCGSPDGAASGNIGYSYGPVENPPADGVYPAGTIAMARANSLYSQGSQFFITYGPTTLSPADGGYTVFGQITSGLDQFISQIAAKGVIASANSTSDGAPVVSTKITQLTVQ